MIDLTTTSSLQRPVELLLFERPGTCFGLSGSDRPPAATTLVVLVRHLVIGNCCPAVLEAMVDSRLGVVLSMLHESPSTTGRLTAWRSWRTRPGLPLPQACPGGGHTAVDLPDPLSTAVARNLLAQGQAEGGGLSGGYGNATPHSRERCSMARNVQRLAEATESASIIHRAPGSGRSVVMRTPNAVVLCAELPDFRFNA